MYRSQNIEANARAPMLAEFRQARGEGIAIGLAAVWGERLHDGGRGYSDVRHVTEGEARSGVTSYGSFPGTRSPVQPEWNEFQANGRCNCKGHSNGRESEFHSHTYTGRTSKAKIGAAWDSKESWRKNQRNQASEKSDEIVCAYANRKRKKCGIKSPHDNNRTTIQSRSRKLQDSVTNNNAFLRELKKENVRPVSGGNVIFNRSH